MRLTTVALLWFAGIALAFGVSAAIKGLRDSRMVRSPLPPFATVSFTWETS